MADDDGGEADEREIDARASSPETAGTNDDQSTPHAEPSEDGDADQRGHDEESPEESDADRRIPGEAATEETDTHGRTPDAVPAGTSIDDTDVDSEPDADRSAATGDSVGGRTAESAAGTDDPAHEHPDATSRGEPTGPVDAEPSTGADAPETADAPTNEGDGNDAMPGVPDPATRADRAIPEDVRKYERFKKMDGAEYERVNQFLRDRTYITAREWAIARLCSDFRTETGVEMTKIGENLPELVPFMTDTYTPQAVNQARSSFEGKVRKAGATFLYGAMCDFFTAEELDDVMYEVTEVAKFLLEVEGVDLSVEEELEAEERISSVMREVREASRELREEEIGDDE